MSRVAVVAHSGKSVGGGLEELRAALEREGVVDPLWYEVDKSKRAPKCVTHALEHGADLLFVWGGDGTVQRCVDAIAASRDADRVPLAIVPAGTANVLADNLGLERDVETAVHVGLHGGRRSIDVGRVDGEHFAAMAGVGFDARLIGGVSGSMKKRVGRLAYVWSGAKNLRAPRFRARIAIDGTSWFDGSAASVLVGNVGRLMGGLDVFPQARPDDGRLDVGVVTADGVVQWARALTRALVTNPDDSPFVRATTARKIRVDLDRKVLYEVDGGERTATRQLKVKVLPSAVQVCVP